ncbi:hypothetical protein Tco_0018527 [Tanacetum coccineum]
MESLHSNSQEGETVCNKSAKENSFDSETKDVHGLSNEDLKGTHIEHGFKRAFISLFGQDVETFKSTIMSSAKDAYSKPINDKEPMAEVHLTVEHNVLANEQQHAKQPEFNNEGMVDQDAEQCQVKNLTEHRSSPNKSFVVHEKPSPRSCLRWKSTGKIFKTVGLRWTPIGKLFASSTTKVDSKPPHGSNVDITNPHECIQTLDTSAGTLNLDTVPVAAAPRPVDPTDTPLSTSIEQDAPGASTSSTIQVTQSPVIFEGVEE